MLRQSLLLTCCLSLVPAFACDAGDKGEKAAANSNQAKSADAPAGAASGKKINLNTASEDDFKALPGVGDKMAHEFEEYRPYASIQQFRKEIGKYVDADKVAEYEKLVFVPIKFNDCDGDTLQQIPGVDAKGAEAIIAGRPFGDDVAFLTKVKDVAGADAETAAMDLIAKDG